MDILLIGFWFLLVILIPVIFFLTVNHTLSHGLALKDIIAKIIISAIAYIIVSPIVIFMVLFIIVGPDPNPSFEKNFGIAHSIGGLIVICGYAGIGYALCSFVAGKFVKFEMFWNNEEIQTTSLGLE